MKILLLFLLLTTSVFADTASENISSMGEQNIAVLNDELRKAAFQNSKNSKATANNAAAISNLEDEFNTSTGHDHDGTDSKKVEASNLLATGITADYILYSNGVTVGSKPIVYYPVFTSDSTASIASATTERCAADADYTKKKEITVFGSGTINVSFQLKGGLGGTQAVAKIYKNDVAVGTERTDAIGTYVTFTEAIANVSRGDKLQLYMHNSAPWNTVCVKDFILYGTQSTIDTD